MIGGERHSDGALVTRARLPGTSAGFICKDGKIAKSARLEVELPEMAFEVSDRHAVQATFDSTA